MKRNKNKKKKDPIKKPEWLKLLVKVKSCSGIHTLRSMMKIKVSKDIDR